MVPGFELTTFGIFYHGQVLPINWGNAAKLRLNGRNFHRNIFYGLGLLFHLLK